MSKLVEYQYSFSAILSAVATTLPIMLTLLRMFNEGCAVQASSNADSTVRVRALKLLFGRDLIWDVYIGRGKLDVRENSRKLAREIHGEY